MLQVIPLVRVLQVMLWSLVPLVMLMVRVRHWMVPGMGRWPVIGMGPRHSLQGAWRVALLVGGPASPSGVRCLWCWGGSSPLLAEGLGCLYPSLLGGICGWGWQWVRCHSWLRVVGFFGVGWGVSCGVVYVCGAGGFRAFVCFVCLWRLLKPVRTPVAIFGSLGVCIHGPARRHLLISYSRIHLT